MARAQQEVADFVRERPAQHTPHGALAEQGQPRDAGRRRRRGGHERGDCLRVQGDRRLRHAIEEPNGGERSAMVFWLSVSVTASPIAPSRPAWLGLDARTSTPCAPQMDVTSFIAGASSAGSIGSPAKTMSTRRPGGDFREPNQTQEQHGRDGHVHMGPNQSESFVARGVSCHRRTGSETLACARASGGQSSEGKWREELLFSKGVLCQHVRAALF